MDKMVSGRDVFRYTVLCLIFSTGRNLLMSKGVVLLLQCFQLYCCGPACFLARLGHEHTS